MHEPKTSDVKEAIIRESTRLFLANGFRGTSVKEITEAAGIGRGTLYWYFKSKEEILITIFRKFETELLDKLSETVRGCKGDFTVRYRLFHKYSTEFARDNRDLCLAFNTLLNEISGTHTEAEKVAKAVYGKFDIIVEGMLEAGKRDGSVNRDVDSALYAHAVIACHTGMLVQWLVKGESLDARAFVKTVRDFILKGLTQKGP
ncbi:MAG: TetR/AcrR family transcriptional regulator [Deltaproteobacteria bacterium]|nr:TetR/AcrR family transcriptional regulator [Deltaproteobacteria bacterium]